eukprot:snap_masked-scaffold_8-processed-gene-14.34-mRNA-1 protein AED:1.00 eAED:1.00 QI:0/0/0/0/1/1/2/0/66
MTETYIMGSSYSNIESQWCFMIFFLRRLFHEDDTKVEWLRNIYNVRNRKYHDCELMKQFPIVTGLS